ncbi:protein tweety homolog 1 isoform X1 [Gasterosteus aculeatus]|uniref:Protein tweety homolog n=1 Tax=Gasterosteus aculeatus aculeatus TaxID=481459 RepID=G3P9A7_GASAC|nr:protein tweety homolog 1 isoform X1 [Gasterosteus aculeatus aculeatus]XP_040022090.1 protein tweety homolog 1 isoform X1 [Gasterosteus aculeatus aculeatus]
MNAMTTVPSYTPSLWVRLCHALPRLDLTMEMKDNVFVPDSWEYQQTLLVLSSLSAIALVISLLVVLSFLIHYCCCHRGDRSEGSEEEEEDEDASTGHGYSGKKGRGICCVTWVAVASVTLCCVAIGIGFYGNSEANDGMYQLTSSLLTANYTLASIDLLISDTVSGLQLSVSGPLTSMEELFTGSKPFLASTRNCRRLSENVINLLSSISMVRSSADAGLANDSVGGASITPLTPVPPSVAPTVVPAGGLMPSPFSPGWAANTLMVNEDYRWLSYVLLLLLDLIVCLFILLGLAKQARWLLILMTVLAWLALFLSWGSLGLETATVVALSDFCSDTNTFVVNSTHFNTGTSSDVLDYYLTCSRRMNSPFQQLLTQSQRALSNIHTHLSSLDRNALTQFPKAEKSLREVQQILNSTEGNFHQLVALLNCRGLNKDYIDSLKGLCYDGMEGLLYLSLYSFLSALAFTAILCSLPGAWRSFPSESEEYEDSDSESEDPFTSHQARRQTASGSQRGAMAPFYNYPGAGWTPPFSSAPPLPTPNVSSNGNPGYESLPLTDRQSPPPSYSPSMLTGYGGGQSHPNPAHSRNLYSR